MKSLWIPVIIVFVCFACRKESFTTNTEAKLQTSVDTLHFDTVFTTASSVSQFIKIINSNNKSIKVNTVRLAGGTSSPFKINVDGIVGPQVSGVDILANDSVYIYVTISINPTAQSLPFIVRDSVEINYNGNTKWVQLDAFGQNAHFFRNRKITGNEIWNNDLPYVILDKIIVDTPATLTINKGCKIYLHADAPFIVNGSLQVKGEKYDSTRIVFAGDRLDDPYRNFPASYPGIIFMPSSHDNVIEYAIIKNTYQGVAVAEPSSSGVKLSLKETIIDNAYTNGLIGVHTSIDAENVLITNCGQNLALGGGGNYNFKHCTIATYSTNFVQHKEPVLLLTNYTVQNNVATATNLTASFTNCILYGEQNGFVNNEVVTDIKGSIVPSINFTKVLWRQTTSPSGSGITINGAINQEPVFDSVNTSQRFFNFRLKTNSPAINTGTSTAITIDIDGKPRPVGLPDLGAYEKQ